MKHKIEVVCAGNLARSPIAEAVGNEYVKQQGLSDQLEIVSSGAMVDTPLDYQRAMRFIGLAAALPDAYRTSPSPDGQSLLDEILIGILANDDTADRYARDSAYRAAVNALTTRYREDLRHVGRTMRDLVLGEVGLQYRTDAVQTDARPDVALVLGLDSKVTALAKQIYRESGNQVAVSTLGAYTSMDSEIEDPVGIAIPEPYRVLRDALIEQMRCAVDRFAGEKRLRT